MHIYEIPLGNFPSLQYNIAPYAVLLPVITAHQLGSHRLTCKLIELRPSDLKEYFHKHKMKKSTILCKTEHTELGVNIHNLRT